MNCHDIPHWPTLLTIVPSISLCFRFCSFLSIKDFLASFFLRYFTTAGVMNVADSAKILPDALAIVTVESGKPIWRRWVINVDEYVKTVKNKKQPAMEAGHKSIEKKSFNRFPGLLTSTECRVFKTPGLRLLRCSFMEMWFRGSRREESFFGSWICSWLSLAIILASQISRDQKRTAHPESKSIHAVRESKLEITSGSKEGEIILFNKSIRRMTALTCVRLYFISVVMGPTRTGIQSCSRDNLAALWLISWIASRNRIRPKRNPLLRFEKGEGSSCSLIVRKGQKSQQR